MMYPAVQELAKLLIQNKQWMRTHGEYALVVRLQVRADGWSLLAGSAFPGSHPEGGCWGRTVLRRKSNCQHEARDLIDQAQSQERRMNENLLDLSRGCAGAVPP